MEGRIQCCFGGQIHSFKGEVEVPSGAACTILLQPNHPRNVANLQMQPNVAEKGASWKLKVKKCAFNSLSGIRRNTCICWVDWLTEN